MIGEKITNVKKVIYSVKANHKKGNSSMVLEDNCWILKEPDETKGEESNWIHGAEIGSKRKKDFMGQGWMRKN